jgi:NADPH:quinone reductase-like Zn-dependent oxidoreductase
VAFKHQIKIGENIMKAIVFTEYGSPAVLQLKEVEKPTPKDDEILVKVRAHSIKVGDLWARNFKRFTPSTFSMPAVFWLPARIAMGFNKPTRNTLGAEFSGEIAAVGRDVKRFKVGDQVFGYRAMDFGANAEYLCMPESKLVIQKPANMTYEEIATVPYGALTALTLLRKVNIQRGQKVLINGASGGIGSAAVQLAKYYGAHVTGVCGTPRMEFVKALGADKVIDYTKEDFTKNGETYDVILDIRGKLSFDKCKNSLKENGRLLYASFKMKQVFQMLWTSKFSSKKVICALSNETLADLTLIKELVEAGKIKAIVDRCFPLEQTADAHRYIESGDNTGNVVITVGH